MNLFLRCQFVPVFMLSMFCLVSCKQKPERIDNGKSVSVQRKSTADMISFIVSLDTLAGSKKLKPVINKQDSIQSLMPEKEKNPFYHYFRARKFSLAKKKDSALAAYQRMKGYRKNDDIELLKENTIILFTIANGSMVEAQLMNRILSGLKAAETQKSCLTYRYYDLIAQAYYQNNNEQKSLEYAAKYFAAHPYKNHPVIKQRYFDISFLLASRLGDLNKMLYYNNQARILAVNIKDSLALARTYDNQAQIYSKQRKTGKALDYSRIYFGFLKKTDNLNDIAYNNLATAFIQNNQPDSAIFYYRAGMEMEKRDPSGKRKTTPYMGLIDAYKFKGDYKSALAASDSLYKTEIRNNKAIEAAKIAELHEKYEVEKKDRSIDELNSRNKLNEKLINQQRWLLFMVLVISLAAVSLFIISYHQLRLKDKNKLLAADNQRLIMEQKLLQVQLNPHFIFNAISNLQGLISSGNTSESVRYLKSFSGLLRSILEQNRKDFISIDEEIASLNNYLLLQQMRYADTFTYRISVSEEIDAQAILIPPMLIQPFVENSIEHGFRNIPYEGLLKISFEQQANQLEITIDDNGCGLGNKASGNQQKQSLAQTILAERFEAIFCRYSQNASFTLNDKKDTGEIGVLVKINIPIIND
ncbi:tetratricopeptide repeat-containing sensor histidine kinase [Pedobacter terrae]|uniref:tetratricopeptide repeat-containing sensor histidine kinase n=1 Tax=Pedobacter terrae TaxID=405671 RepID=UPI002FF98B03